MLEKQKEARRERILAAARKIISTRGIEQLTLRDLAREAEVSVPTLYNLIGGKEAILAAEMETVFKLVEASLANVGDAYPESIFRMLEVSNNIVKLGERYYRGLLQLFLTSPESRPLRQRAEQQQIERIAGILAAAQKRGEVVANLDANATAYLAYCQYMSAILMWGIGELDNDGLTAASTSGVCMVLLGLSVGDAKEKLEAALAEALPQLTPHRTVLQNIDPDSEDNAV